MPGTYKGALILQVKLYKCTNEAFYTLNIQRKELDKFFLKKMLSQKNNCSLPIHVTCHFKLVQCSLMYVFSSSKEYKSKPIWCPFCSGEHTGKWYWIRKVKSFKNSSKVEVQRKQVPDCTCDLTRFRRQCFRNTVLIYIIWRVVTLIKLVIMSVQF